MVANSSNAHLFGLIAQNRNNSVQFGTPTTFIPEGTNLYFTTARARGAIGATSPITYNATTGIISSSGLTQSIVVQTSPTTTATLNFTNGILTSVS